MRGRASPSRRRGPTPCDTLGSSPPVARSFSPARLNAVGAGLPASPRAGRARLHYVEREDPGDGHPQPPRGTAIVPARTSACPQPGPGIRAPAARPRQRPAVARTPAHKLVPEAIRKLSPNHLTDSLLRWCRRGAPGRIESRPQESFEEHRRGRPRVRCCGRARSSRRPWGRRRRWRRLFGVRRRLCIYASGRAGGAGTGFPRT